MDGLVAESQRVLGIDPGLNITGYGVVDVGRGRIADGTGGNQMPSGLLGGGHVRLCEAGVVRGVSRNSLAARVHEIHTGVEEVIANFSPDVIAIEQLYSHYARPKTAILMGHARGVICLAATQAGIPVVHYAATQVKKVMTGNGRAPKSQIQLAVQREFGLSEPPESPDVADALAIALCHVYLLTPKSVLGG